MNRWPPPSLGHLARLTDGVGIVEHALLDEPRHDAGYCTDDAGRLLAVASTLPADRRAHRLATVALGFLAVAHDGGGSFRLRLRAPGAWTDDEPSDDATGRALQGLGTAAARAPWPEVARGALELFGVAAGFRSRHLRATAHAALGAVEVLRAAPDHDGARRLVEGAAELLVRPTPGPTWPWPEPRLTYANALVPEAALAVAIALGDRDGAGRALELLDWLVDEESRQRWFSFAPVGGRGPGDAKPGFDQQPVEAWAMAAACSRAWEATGEDRWAGAVGRAASWFLGSNDVGAVVCDPSTGAGFDGLEQRGVNGNQGAESTLAFVATMALARSLPSSPQAAPAGAAAGEDGTGSRASTCPPARPGWT